MHYGARMSYASRSHISSPRNYVTQDVALSNNLTYAHGDTFIIRADSTHYLNSNGPGRNTVRLMSYEQYSNHVAVFNIRHMPTGCGYAKC